MRRRSDVLNGMKSDKCPPRKVSKEYNAADKGTGMLSRAMKSKKKPR